MNRVIFVNGPEPTGFGFVNVAGSATFDQMCCGTTKIRFSVVPMNCESGVFRLIATLEPLRLIETTFVPGRKSPSWSRNLSCLPAVSV